MAVAATGSRKPDRRAARLLPGLRLRCCDKAVLPSAMHSGAGRPGCGPLRGRAARRAMAFRVLPGPAPGGARIRGPSALGHRRYLARRTGGIPENSQKKLCRVAAVTLRADHRTTTCIDTITISHSTGRCGAWGYRGAGCLQALVLGVVSPDSWCPFGHGMLTRSRLRAVSSL